MSVRIQMSARSNKALALISGVVVAGIVLTQFAGVAQGDSSDRGLARKLARLKVVSGAYHNEALALAGGFEATDTCVASPEGGMGYHYANPDRSQDNVVDSDKPEVLLYAPGPGNERKLVAVEYFKADEDQDLSTDDDRPALFGRPFDGPMPGHEPDMPVHYDLHVWVWRSNPEGVFAPFSPRVSCPS